MLNFKGVEEQKSNGLDQWKKNQEKINILLHQYNAKKVLTPEQEVLLSKIHDMEETGTRPRKEDLELIAELCGYSKGWVHYKELELKLK